MTLSDFITKWQNKPVDTDGVYPSQCMDLAHQYLIDMFGITNPQVLSAPSAYLVYTNFDSIVGHEQFERIPNTPDGVPQAGDLVFFGTQIGQWGHVCIFVDGDSNSFRSFDANWPTGTLPHIQTHDYRGVLGWLRFKAQQPSNDLQACLKAHSEAMTAIKDRDSEILKLNGVISNKEAERVLIADKLSKCLNQPNNSVELQNKLTALQAKYDKLKSTPSKAIIDLLFKIAEKLGVTL